MEVKAIRDEQTYRTTLARVSALVDLDPAPDSPEGEELEVLGTLVEAYETRHYPIGSPDPIEAIRFRMEQSGITIKDLEPIIGKSNRVYEVLARKRPLTLAMIRRLNTRLGIPASVLISDYTLA
ncbi:transcriptional regulator [Acidovorax sp.]|uniref:helix-turn-helix domain-containing protein n=1 Tax=Acidovorax sp. TaxID=1872122 RepID=UPI002ACD6B95|nr:transcriptional regulator [Acidovorax sp.]MDZ7865469.1 transcriptional regulator [Acidovorax sp.]